MKSKSILEILFYTLFTMSNFECTVILYPIHRHVAVLETHVRRGIGQLVSLELESNVEL